MFKAKFVEGAYKEDILAQTIAIAHVHATLALVSTTAGEPNRTTKHMEKARAYLAEVEED